MSNTKNIQELNLKNLLVVSKFLNKIEHFIFYGTLLGLTRNSEIIKGDDDVDFMVNLKLKNQVLKAMERDKSFKMNKKVSNEYFAQFIKKENNIMSFIDFYFFIKKPKFNYIIERHNWLANVNDENFALHFPNKMIFPIKKNKKFKSVCIPNKPKSLLKILYGKNWLFPLQKNIEYRIEIKDNKPNIIRRSFLGAITRWFKSKVDIKKYKKII